MTNTTTEPRYESFRVSILWSGKGFSKAIRNAKHYDGRFDPETKTWTIKLWAAGWLPVARNQGIDAFLADAGLVLNSNITN